MQPDKAKAPDNAAVSKDAIAASATNDPEAPVNVRGFASLKFHGYRLLLISTECGNLGNSVRNIVNAWQVYELTNSSVQLGFTFLLQGLPSILFAIFGGTLADM